MVVLVLAFALGAWLGWRRAAARGGDRLDRLQYGAVHGIVACLAALFALVVLARLGVL